MATTTFIFSSNTSDTIPKTCKNQTDNVTKKLLLVAKQSISVMMNIHSLTHTP